MPIQYYWGQKTEFTNYPVGECKENGGGLWMQLPDGTWAAPDDSLNLCQKQTSSNGLPSLPSWYQDSWQGNGLDPTFPWSYINPTQQYQWGTNYPGGYSDYNDWFTKCVLMESFMPRPECQQFGRAGYNWPISQPWGYYNNQSDYLMANQENTPYSSHTYISAEGKVGQILAGVLLGYGLNQWLK